MTSVRSSAFPADCLHCGVCCFSKSATYITLAEADIARLGDDAGRLVRHLGRSTHMRMEGGHCAALEITTHRGAPPVFFCSIYGKRPQVCRRLARGSPACEAELASKAARIASEYG